VTTSSKLCSDWFIGVDKSDEEAKKARIAELRAAEAAFDVLSSMLKQDIEQRRKAQTSNSRYEEPQWAYKQADYNGGIRELERILKTLPIKA